MPPDPRNHPDRPKFMAGFNDARMVADCLRAKTRCGIYAAGFDAGFRGGDPEDLRDLEDLLKKETDR